MRQTTSRRGAVAGVLLCVLLAGCQSTGIAVLNLIGITEKPLVIMSASERGLVDVPLQAIDPFARSRALNDAMSKAIGRPVVTDLCFSFQLQPNLSLGLCHLADVTALQYARMPDRGSFPVLAASVDAKNQLARPALLIVRTDSQLKAAGDLRGKRVAFGSARDARTHHAALSLLRESGLESKDLSLELFPVPGSLKMFARSRDTAQSVLNKSSDAGFVDEQEWDALTESSADASEPSRSQFRVIGKTIAVPERIILRSPALDEATAGRIAQFLFSAGEANPEALKPLGISGYRKPEAADLVACEKLATMQSPSEQAESKPAE